MDKLEVSMRGTMGGITEPRKVSMDSVMVGGRVVALAGYWAWEITSSCWRWAIIIVKIVRRCSGVITTKIRGMAFLPLR